MNEDTLDLQNHSTPSAKDHTRQPARPLPLGDGPPAPNQAATLRHVEQQAAEQHSRSPRHSRDLSDKELQLLQDERHSSYDSTELDSGLGARGSEDTSADQRNGTGPVDEEGDTTEGEDGDSLDDDLMDKISSSPSIDDGGYHLPLHWPVRGASLRSSLPDMKHPRPPIPPHHIQEDSSSPYTSSPRYFPLSYHTYIDESGLSEGRHQQGEYVEIENRASPIDLDFEGRIPHRNSLLLNSGQDPYFPSEEFDDLDEARDGDLDVSEMQNLLLPPDDPLLDNTFDDAKISHPSDQVPSPVYAEIFSIGPQSIFDDDNPDIFFSDDSRFVDSGWGGECLRDVEDIDFEFVYALHTFVATVEGQANATKGDTMVLLDDSNSYWWLVRVVKDSSIGYLPAEHIETPTERLARLNKHRNIDLSQTMLGDNPERSKNPLKKAMRRRNAKTVTFTSPTYVEASDNDYSSDEEEGDGEAFGPEEEATEMQVQRTLEEQDKAATVEPLRLRSAGKESKPNNDLEIAELRTSNGDADEITAVEKPRMSDEVSESLSVNGSAKSRNGVVRNTDSFFKDENQETKKMTLTPTILQDDSSNSNSQTGSTEGRELKPRASLDTLEKYASPPERSKEDKKRKEKKPGMLSGLFKRKDRKSKAQDDEIEESEKISEEITRPSLQPNVSAESLSQDSWAAANTAKQQQQQQPQRQTSKLQKSPPGKAPLSPKQSSIPRDALPIESRMADQQRGVMPPEDRSTPKPAPAVAAADIAPTMRIVEPDTDRGADIVSSSLPVQHPEQRSEQVAPVEPSGIMKEGPSFPAKGVLRHSPSSSELKPEKVKEAKQRVAMDDFDDSSSESEEPSPANLDPQEDNGHRVREAVAKERLSESPVQVSIQDTQPQGAPALMIDSSSQEDPSISSISPPSSAELIDIPREETRTDAVTPSSTTRSSIPPWSDTNLRTYLEDDSEIKDLLLVVHDKSNVAPAGPDHPFVGTLFKDENRRLGEMSNRLDGLLTEWLSRKSTSGGR